MKPGSSGSSAQAGASSNAEAGRHLFGQELDRPDGLDGLRAQSETRSN